MVGEHKKRVILTLHEMDITMLEVIAQNTGLTKSEIVRHMFFNYTLQFWSAPNEEIERWKKYANQQKK